MKKSKLTNLNKLKSVVEKAQSKLKKDIKETTELNSKIEQDNNSPEIDIKELKSNLDKILVSLGQVININLAEKSNINKAKGILESTKNQTSNIDKQIKKTYKDFIPDNDEEDVEPLDKNVDIKK